MRKPFSLTKAYCTIIMSAFTATILFQLFIVSEKNITSTSLLSEPDIRYAIAGTPSDKKQLIRQNNQLTLKCNATNIYKEKMCGVVFFLPLDKNTHKYPSLDPNSHLITDIVASAETSRFSGKVSVFIKTIYDLKNPALTEENTKYQAVKFNPLNTHKINLSDFNVENWWLNKYEIPYEHSHRDLDNVVSIEVFISDIPLIYPSHYALNIKALNLIERRIHQKDYTTWALKLWFILISVLLFHYFLITKIRLKNSKKALYTDKETGFFNIDRLVRDFANSDNDKRQIHSLKVINYETLCKKIGKELTLDIIIFTWYRCIIELRKNRLRVYRIDENEFVIINEGEPLTDQNYNIVFETCAIGTDVRNLGKFSLDVVLGVIDPGDAPESAQQLIENCQLITSYAESHDQQLVHYSMALLKEHKEEMFILNSMKESLTNNDFYLQFMPIYNRKENTISGAEAILRSHSSKLKDYQPETYIRIAEKYGYIRTIDLWVIESAFKTILSYEHLIDENFRLSINISSREMLDNSFIEEFEYLLNKYQINPSILCMEITETFYVDIDLYEIKNISKLRSLGCSISLDDFGTGFTSFPTLLKLSANEIKIDKSYVSQLGNKHYDILIQSFINIAKVYDYDIVAEGIETKEQLETLYQMGCNHFQGFYIGKPTDLPQAIDISLN